MGRSVRRAIRSALSGSRLRTAFLFASVALFTLALVRLLLSGSHFQSDDLFHFAQVREQSLLEFLATPIDIHFVPLHRLATYLLYKLSPLNYVAALVVLLAFHLGGLWYVHRILREVGWRSSNRVLLLACALSAYFFVPLVWWSSGIHRFPYVFCAAACCYHYIRHRREPSARHVTAVVVFFVAAVAFYTKGILIPAYLLALEVCLVRRTPRRRLWRNLMLVAILGAIGALGLWLTRALVEGPFSGLHLDLRFLLDLELQSFKRLGYGLLTATSELQLPGLAVAAFWAALLVTSIVLAPFNALVWAAGLAALALNFAALAMSQRSVHLGIALAHTPRLYYELIFLAVIFLGIILANCAPRAAALLRRLPVRALFGRGARVVAGLSLCLFAAGYAAASYAHSHSLFVGKFEDSRKSKVFVDNLGRDLRELRRANKLDVVFAEDYTPRYFTGIYVAMPYSRLLPVFGFHGRVGPYAAASHVVDEAGHVVTVTPRETPEPVGGKGRVMFGRLCVDSALVYLTRTNGRAWDGAGQLDDATRAKADDAGRRFLLRVLRQPWADLRRVRGLYAGLTARAGLARSAAPDVVAQLEIAGVRVVLTPEAKDTYHARWRQNNCTWLRFFGAEHRIALNVFDADLGRPDAIGHRGWTGLPKALLVKPHAVFADTIRRGRTGLLAVQLSLAREILRGGRGPRFRNPRLGRYFIDRCARWAKQCDQAAADVFCQRLGYRRARSYLTAPRSPTWIQDDGRVCGNDPKQLCYALVSIHCER